MGTKSNIASGAAKAAGKGTKAWAIAMTCVAGASAATAVAVPVVMTVTQKQNIAKYTITFESNGGSEVKSQEVESDKTGVEPIIPTRNGFTFNGWYCDEALTQPFDWNTKITSNIKLYAKWTDAIVSRTCKVKFDLGGAEVIGGSINRNITKGTPFSQINCPSFIYPEGKKFVRWDCNDDFIINDDENETTITAIYEDLKEGEVAKHRLNFVIDGSEHLEYGELHFDVEKGKTWPQVVANSKFPVITNKGFIENDFRMPPKDDAQEITYFDQDYVFGQNASYLTANVNWEAKEDGVEYSRVMFLINEDDVNKGDITSGYRTIEVKKGTKWTDVPKPIVEGYKVGDKVYPFNGWNFSGEEINDDYVYTYAKFGQPTDTFTHKIVLSAGAIGEFEPVGDKSHTITKQTASEQVKFSDFDTEEEGKFLTKNTPKIKSEYKGKYEFWGWGVNANDSIPVGSTYLTAIYYNVEKCYIIFASGDDVSITGSQAFYVNKNITWAEFNNKYTAPTAAKVGGWTHTGWKDSNDNIITDETVISDNIVLYPVFVKTTAYYDVNLTINSQYGQLSETKLTVPENSTWAQVKKDIGLTMDSKYILLGWVNDETAKVMEDSDVVKSNLSVTANCDLLLNHCVKATVSETTTLSITLFNSPVIYYSIDEGENWTQIQAFQDITLNPGNVYFKGVNNTKTFGRDGTSTNLKFKNGKISLSGNIMTLIDSSILPTKITNTYQFAKLFQSSSGLTSVSSDFLPATVLTERCYYLMFQDCINLVSAPIELQADVAPNGAYENMFSSCAKLVDVPFIYASTLQDDSCNGMFQGCSALKYIVTFAPSKVATRSCADMFKNCTSLLVAPSLPAKQLDNQCYSEMFYNCTNLLYCRDLMAEDSAYHCYYEMFKGCTSLVTAPYINLKNVSESCCEDMFFGCTSLENVQESFTLSVQNKFRFAKCLYSMFYNCTKLVNIPQITLNLVEGADLGSFNTGLQTTFYKTGDSKITVSRIAIGNPIPAGGYKIIEWQTDRPTQTETFDGMTCSTEGWANTNLEPGYIYYYTIN